MRYILLATVVTIFSLISPFSASAATTPSFPSCLTPQGSLKASYATGTHGIVGSSQTYTGQDTVYQLNENQVLQCYCQNTGQGIQTNWLKVQDLSENDIKVLENDGWILIPNGALWGLDQTAYLAKNLNFSCQGSSRGSSNSSSGSSSDPAKTTQAVLAAATSLAGTGNVITTLSVFLLGVFSLMIAIYLKRLNK